eukprot:6421036-Pyramimonas_sp.AAC.1
MDQSDLAVLGHGVVQHSVDVGEPHKNLQCRVPAQRELGLPPQVYSQKGPIRRRKHGYILTRGQSDAGSTGIFSRGADQTQESRVYSHDGPISTRTCPPRVYSHDGPIRRRMHGYILTMDQSVRVPAPP